MLYSLIPPILIVLSLCAIIIFLMKKSPQIEKIASESEAVKNEAGTGQGSGGFSSRIKNKMKNMETEKLKSFFLVILEKITSKSRIIFLKMESKCGNLASSIRNRRVKSGQERIALGEEASADKRAFETNKNEIFKKLSEYKAGKNKGERQAKREMIVEEGFEEKPIKPIISEKIVSPSKGETKDRLEELLIERIAVNPKDIEAYERLGEYYLEIKSLDDSKECFKQVIRLDPANRNAKYRMRRLENLLAKR